MAAGMALASVMFVSPSPASAGPTIDGAFDGTGYARAGTTTTLRVAGRGGVPGWATAVALNLTVTDTAWHGWATVWACGTPRPNASNINFTPGATIANSVITKIGTNGDVCIYTDQRTHLIVDVAGYFASSSGYTPITPARLIDTRPGGATIDGAHRATGRATAGTTTAVRVAGRGGVPANARAVALNLTVTDTAWHGWATVWACGTPRPNASNINFTPGATIANSVITKIGTNGDVCIYTDQRTHLIVDVAGHFTGNTGYAPLTPARLIDTRPNNPISAAEDLFRILLDDHRAALGLAPVALDPAMSDFARNWSQTMAASWFRHSGGPYSENIIVWPNPSLTPEQVASGFFSAWVNSAPHYANMTQPYWNYVGIGFHQSGSGWYGTLEFRS